jgi:hypothetical protein
MRRSKGCGRGGSDHATAALVFIGASLRKAVKAKRRMIRERPNKWSK